MIERRPEIELLLCCAQTCLDSERAERVGALLRHDIDWVYLLQTARPHGMMPLLYWHLNATCPEAVPQATLDHLRDHFDKNTRRNLVLTGELCRILNLLEAHGIPALPFKGPALASFVYGDLALREFGDLDILVRKEDASRAKERLIRRGYRPQVHLTGGQETAYLQSQCEYSLDRDDGRVHLDIHWHIVPRCFAFPLDPEPLWERLVPTSLSGVTVPSLSPEDLLLILCAHNAKHLWERLVWICDVARLIDVHKGMNWGRVMKQAIGSCSERMLFLGLWLAHDLLGAALPEDVGQRVQADSVAVSLAAQVREQLFREAHGQPGFLKRYLFHIRVRECLWDRVQCCLRQAMTPTIRDLALLPLPVSLSFLYYLLRPIRLVGKYGLSPLRMRMRTDRYE